MPDPSAPLSDLELRNLITRVFRPGPGDRALAILIDLPDDAVADEPAWAERRAIAADWARRLDRHADTLGLGVQLVATRNARRNNADLPARAWRLPLDLTPPARADALDPSATVALDDLFSETDIVIAPTRFSATAPLKLAARRHGLRAATMPGFVPAMHAALRLDFDEIDRRVDACKHWLDRATGARFVFIGPDATDTLELDLRHRQGHASSGLLRTPGTAGNLPSGEAYVVPYEGERAGDASRSSGVLPVQLDDEVVRYRVTENRAVEVLSRGPVSTRERERLAAEPAYGNLAELGLGVLGDLGVEPIGVTLLDEKLGLHIAFGRSDHFGGQVGAADFSRPEAVVHIDRVYLPAIQPRIVVSRADLTLEDGTEQPLMRDGRFVATFA